MNLAFYILTGVFALPSNHAYLASLSLWKASPILPVFVTLCSVSTIGVASWIWLRGRGEGIIRKRFRALAFSLAWTASALMPVLFIVAERTVFLASIGIAMTLSILFVSAWECVKEDNKQLARGVALCFCFMFGQMC